MNGAHYAGAPTEEGAEQLAAIWRGLRHELESLDETIAYHVAPPLCPLIERAATRTEAWLAEGGLERREILHELNAHYQN